MLRSTSKALLLSLTTALALPLTMPASAAPGEPVDVVAPWEISSVDPVQAGFVFGRMQIAETLVDSDLKGQLVPGLATSWESDDSQTWRFTLRDGVRFHNGSEMSPETVAASLNRTLQEPGVLSQAEITAIEVEPDSLVIRLAKPFAALPSLLTHYSTQILAPAAYDDAGDVRQLIATGPFRITSLQPPQRLVAERFDDYWGKAPAIPGVSYLATPRGETRALMAQSGDADIIFTLDAASQARLKMSPDIEIHAVPIPRTVAIKLNADKPGFDSPESREALSLAIDRQGIARGVMRVEDAAANQLLPPGVSDWHLADLPAPQQDLERARQLLAEQGWQPGDDGILVRDGQPFTATLTTFADRPELPVIATALQDQFRQLGVDVAVNVANASEIPLTHQDGSLEMGLMARNFGLVPDPLPLMLEDFGPEGGDWGAMNWHSEALQADLDALRTATEPARRRALSQQAAQVLHQQLPVIPVAWYTQTAAIDAGLEGFAIDPFERSYRLSELEWEDS